MCEKQTNEVMNIVLDTSYLLDPDLLLENEDFKSKIYDITFKAIKENISNLPKNLIIFNLIDLGLEISLSRHDCNVFLQNMLESYIKLEDFNKCKEISSYINKLDGITK